ncbi:hypothetical protein NBRC116592_14510 [Colwellia sp. KU-HH00111]|uniref:hypothetical protein n=1 Tax=Colwellia sp. KU-HH00111 TaxID=3127652 RepID=UPI003108CD01
MNLYLVILVLFLFIPVIIYGDYKTGHEKCQHNSELVIAVTPLLALFYSSQFVYALIMLMLLVLYGVGLKVVAHKYRWVEFDLKLMKNHSIGSVFLALFGYGLYQLVAYLGDLFVSIDFAYYTNGDLLLFKINSAIAALNHWPYLTYGALIAVILSATLFDRLPARQNKDEVSLFVVLFLIPASLILPWYSDHYWWFLLGTFIGMPLVVFFVYGYKEENKHEAIDIARIFCYVYFALSHVNVLVYWLCS